MTVPVDSYRPLRVLVGMPFGWAHGGAERLLDDFIRHAPEVAVEPHVVFLQDGTWPGELRARGVPATVVLPGRFRHLHRNVAAIGSLRRLMLRERPDVVFGWIARAHLLFAPAAVAAGLRRRLVWFQHLIGCEPVERAATLLPAELVVANSQAAAEAQASVWPHRRIFVATPGIEPPALLDAGALAALRDELGVPSGATVVGISGRLVRRKNQAAVLRAVALLRRRGRDVHALILGGVGNNLDLGYGAELAALAAALEIERHVTFTGLRTDPVAITQLMDVAVNASDPEPFGLVVLEALGVGVPVVAVQRGGPAEIIEPGRTGVLVKDASPESLADALMPLLDDPQRRSEMGRAGRATVLARYTIDRFARDIRRALDQVVAGS